MDGAPVVTGRAEWEDDNDGETGDPEVEGAATFLPPPRRTMGALPARREGKDEEKLGYGGGAGRFFNASFFLATQSPPLAKWIPTFS